MLCDMSEKVCSDSPTAQGFEFRNFGVIFSADAREGCIHIFFSLHGKGAGVYFRRLVLISGVLYGPFFLRSLFFVLLACTIYESFIYLKNKKEASTARKENCGVLRFLISCTGFAGVFWGGGAEHAIYYHQ